MEYIDYVLADPATEEFAHIVGGKVYLAPVLDAVDIRDNVTHYTYLADALDAAKKHGLCVMEVVIRVGKAEYMGKGCQKENT